MSMFQVSGVVLHLFDAPGRIDRDTGAVDDDKPKVQLLGEIPQRNGQAKFDVITLTCHNPSDFDGLKGNGSWCRSACSRLAKATSSITSRKAVSRV